MIGGVTASRSGAFILPKISEKIILPTVFFFLQGLIILAFYFFANSALLILVLSFFIGVFGFATVDCVFYQCCQITFLTI